MRRAIRKVRPLFTTALLAVVLFASSYWFYTASAICDVPIAYHIGAIDSRFDITKEEALAAASQAESMWEDATGRNLFTYDETSEFTIEFVFDERQENTVKEIELREVLERKEYESGAIKEQYDDLLERYDDLLVDYEKRKVSYNKKLEGYNKEVARWNEAGGAPEDIFENLENRQAELAKEQNELNTVAYALNEIVEDMNTIGDRGNSVIEDYNEIVDTYNDRFNEEREFTQGDYQGDRIHIYQFGSPQELRIVLAHEFGHALSLDHVDGEESVMYHFMEAQDMAGGVTEKDVEEFERVCGDESFTLWSIL